MDVEKLLREELESEPSNWDAHFQLAKLLSWQQKFAEAESEYQMLLANDPGNADYLFGLGQVGVWQGKPLSVLTEIETAELLQSQNPEIWRLHIQALLAIDDALSRWQAAKIQQRAVELFPYLEWSELTNLASDVAVGSGESCLSKTLKLLQNNKTELGASYDVLSKHKGFWRSEFLNVEHQFAAHESVYANYLHTERFSLTDEQFLLGGYYPHAENLILNLEANFSPYASLLARDSLMTSMQWEFYPTWSLIGGYRHSDYLTGSLQQMHAGFDHYLTDFRLAYTFKATDAFYSIQYGQRFDLAYYYQNSNFVMLTYNTGAEISGFQGLVYNTQFIGLHGQHWFDQDWAITWDLAFSQQGSAYSRENISLGIRRAF